MTAAGDDAGRIKVIQDLGKLKVLTPEQVKAASKHLDDFGKGLKDLTGN
jgi:hypothetical protein